MNKKVVIGGTFDLLHKGHRELISHASSLGDVKVGLTSDQMAREMKGEVVDDYGVRESEILRLFPEVEIEKIEDPFGFAVDENFDCIVVSEETRPRAEEINAQRKEKGKEEMVIEEIDTVLSEDGGAISSTRIRNGEIDREGNII